MNESTVNDSTVADGDGGTHLLQVEDHPPWVRNLSEYFRFVSKETRVVEDSRKHNRKRDFYNLQCTICDATKCHLQRGKAKNGPVIINGNSMSTFIRHLNVSFLFMNTTSYLNAALQKYEWS